MDRPDGIPIEFERHVHLMYDLMLTLRFSPI